jgi:EmrB/QacA subfamily drug resistance transporter
VGPAIGGVITDTLGWQWLFWINIPLGLVAFVVIRSLTPESNDPEASSKVDWPGLVTIGLAVFALLYALTEGPAAGWTDPLVLGLLVGAALLAVAWCVIEWRVREPLVNLALFRLRPFDGALTANLTMNLAFAGISYLLVLWLQNVRDFDAVQAGLLMLPSTLGIFLCIPVGGRLSASRGARLPVLIGLVVMSLGLLMLGGVATDSPLWQMGLALIVVGLGLGLLSTPISSTAVGDVPIDLAGTAAGVFKMSSMVGGAIGVALLTGLGRSLSISEWRDAAESAGLSASDIEDAQHALVNSDSFQAAIAHLPLELQQKVTTAVVNAFSAGVADAMVVTGILALVATVLVVFVWPKRKTPATDQEVSA